MTARICVYVLHLEPALGHARHYVGSAKPAQLRRRLRAHVTGRGARFTAAAIQQGCQLTLSALIRHVPRAEEYQVKRSRRAKALCKLCSPQRRAWPRPIHLHADQLDVLDAPTFQQSWAGGLAAACPKAMKKGRST